MLSRLVVHVGVPRLLLPAPRFTRFPAAAAPGDLDGGLHVIRGDSAGGALKAAGARQVIAVPDTLSAGPSARSWSAHATRRARYWRHVYSVTHPGVVLTDTMGGWNPSKTWERDFSLLGQEGFVEEVAAVRSRRVTLWSGGTWIDLLFLAWTLDAINRIEIDVRFAGRLGTTMPLGWLNPQQLVPLADKATAMSGTARAALKELWQAFTAPTPAALEALRRAPPPSLPTLVKGLAVHAALFPRVMGRPRRVHVSAVDEVLLRLLAARGFKRFPDLFKIPPSRSRWPRSGLYAMLAYFGEVFIEWRISGWVKAGAVEEVEVVPSTANRYTRAWRRTERGRALLAGGLKGPGDMPALDVGGYSQRRAPWCCVIERGAWQFAPWR